MTLLRRTFSLSALAMAAGFASRGEAHAAEGDDKTIGAASAPVHIIEYASATCSHCAHFHQTNYARLKTSYIDAGRVRLTLREMLTPPAPVSLAMFQLARCEATDDAEYFRRLAVLFEQQGAILGTGTMAGVRDSLIALGGGWGLSQEQVLACLNDEAGVARIQRSVAEAHSRGISSTPSFLVDGAAMNDPDFRTPDGMARILDARLAERS